MPDPRSSHDASPAEVGSHMFGVTIVTPQGTRAEYNVRHLRAPGVDGDFGVLHGHAPFMTALRIGAIILDTDQGKHIWATSGGFAEVLGDRVTILAETAERADQIDTERAEASKRRALERLAQRGAEEMDLNRANAALARAINRMHVAHSLHEAGH